MPIARKWCSNLCNLTPETLFLNISLISPLHLLYYFNKHGTICVIWKFRGEDCNVDIIKESQL